ncbi:hydroxyacid dehydrogenase [Patescibacteria group bacterium]|nr:hydroxyacid dehydrogenase [Patescibacteria group bacterium]
MKIYFNTKAFDCLEEKKKLDLTEDVSQADILVLGAKPVDFSKASNVKAVYRFGVGRENIPDELLKKGIPQVFFPSEKAKEILYESTANFTVFLIFQMYYCPVTGDIDQWVKKTRNFFRKKNLLIIGLGNIGQRIAKKMELFMSVKTYDIKENKSEALKPLIESADIITLHIPLSKENENFIDAEKLSWMKNDAILINTSRGIIVDEEALYQKMQNSNLRAGFDVFWQEPYNGKLKVFGQSKFFMTPHSASQTIEFVKEGFRDILEIIKKYE